MRNLFILLLVLLSYLHCFAQTTDDEKYEQARNYYEAKDYNKAYPILIELADKNHTKALNLLGVFYNYGYIVPKNMQKAVELYQKSANFGWRLAQRNLGICYERGEGVPANMEKAYAWYDKSFRQYKELAEKGDADAQLEMGVFFYYGRIRSGKNYLAALSWFEKSAHQGNCEALNLLGIMYHSSYGVEKDLNKALEYYTKAAERGNIIAMNNLGWLYRSDEYQELHSDLDYNYKQAEKWYRLAAKDNNAEGLYNLAWFYLDTYPGSPIDKRVEKSAPYFEKAAKLGYGYAQIAVGYADMREKKYNSALKWFDMALKNDCKESCFNLSISTWITICKFFIENSTYTFYWDMDCCDFGHVTYEEKDYIYVGATSNNKFGFLKLSKTGVILGKTPFIYDGDKTFPFYDKETKLFHVTLKKDGEEYGHEITIDITGKEVDNKKK